MWMPVLMSIVASTVDEPGHFYGLLTHSPKLDLHDVHVENCLLLHHDVKYALTSFIKENYLQIVLRSTAQLSPVLPYTCMRWSTTGRVHPYWVLAGNEDGYF
jgi:hypothetical protein